MEQFELNSKIELITDDDEITEGIIHDIIDDKIYVLVTSDDKKFKILYVDDNVRGVVFSGNYGKAFDATITKRIVAEFPIYEISALRNFTTVQRREDVRVPCTLDIKYSIEDGLLNINTNEIEKRYSSFSKYFSDGIARDLSAGGVKFSCDKNLYTNRMLLMELNINDKRLLLKAKVLHKAISVSPKNTLYTYGVQFINISEKQRELIIRYLFLLMRKNRLR